MHGTNAVVGLLRSSHRVAALYVRERDVPEAIRVAAGERRVSVTEVPSRELDRMSAGARHQGVVARLVAYDYVELEDLVAAPGRGAVVLDGVVDPRNLGAIVRSARAAGVRGVVLPHDRSAHVTTTAAIASAGTVFEVPIARVTNLARAIERLKRAGMWTVGLATEADMRLGDLPPLDEPAVVVGGEGAGLRRLVRERCDFVARIPMAEGLDSLNASVAAGVALYELWMRSRDGV